jgi:hypothetical protein
VLPKNKMFLWFIACSWVFFICPIWQSLSFAQSH